MVQATDTFDFNIYPDMDLKARAFIEDGEVVKIKLLFKCGKGQYYHFMNDAGSAADEIYQSTTNE